MSEEEIRIRVDLTKLAYVLNSLNDLLEKGGEGFKRIEKQPST